MKTLVTTLAVAAILSVTPIAQATMIPIGDSGWEAVLPDSVNVGISIDTENDNLVVIEIFKTFTASPQNGQFPPISITFNQIGADAETVLQILINDEIITNNTGVDWTDYHWSLEGPAAFRISATENSNFDTDPFTNATWTPKAGWDADHASALNVDGGTVANGNTYSPGADGGALFIDVDLSGDGPTSFTLTQNPTPEPATLILLVAGLPLLLKHRQRRS